jgi:hypothetical protein
MFLSNSKFLDSRGVAWSAAYNQIAKKNCSDKLVSMGMLDLKTNL